MRPGHLDVPKKKIRVVTRKRHIRMLVEASTIREYKDYEKSMEVRQVIIENPPYVETHPTWFKVAYMLFFTSVGGFGVWYITKIFGS